MQVQGDEMRRLSGWTEPIIERGPVFPNAPADEGLFPKS